MVFDAARFGHVEFRAGTVYDTHSRQHLHFAALASRLGTRRAAAALPVGRRPNASDIDRQTALAMDSALVLEWASGAAVLLRDAAARGCFIYDESLLRPNCRGDDSQPAAAGLPPLTRTPVRRARSDSQHDGGDDLASEAYSAVDAVLVEEGPAAALLRLRTSLRFRSPAFPLAASSVVATRCTTVERRMQGLCVAAVCWAGPPVLLQRGAPRRIITVSGGRVIVNIAAQSPPAPEAAAPIVRHGTPTALPVATTVRDVAGGADLDGAATRDGLPNFHGAVLAAALPASLLVLANRADAPGKQYDLYRLPSTLDEPGGRCSIRDLAFVRRFDARGESVQHFVASGSAGLYLATRRTLLRAASGEWTRTPSDVMCLARATAADSGSDRECDAGGSVDCGVLLGMRNGVAAELDPRVSSPRLRLQTYASFVGDPVIATGVFGGGDDVARFAVTATQSVCLFDARAPGRIVQQLAAPRRGAIPGSASRFAFVPSHSAAFVYDDETDRARLLRVVGGDVETVAEWDTVSAQQAPRSRHPHFAASFFGQLSAGVCARTQRPCCFVIDEVAQFCSALLF